jgi:hypothetical protein
MITGGTKPCQPESFQSSACADCIVGYPAGSLQGWSLILGEKSQALFSNPKNWLPGFRTREASLLPTVEFKAIHKFWSF